MFIIIIIIYLITVLAKIYSCFSSTFKMKSALFPILNYNILSIEFLIFYFINILFVWNKFIFIENSLSSVKNWKCFSNSIISIRNKRKVKEWKKLSVFKVFPWFFCFCFFFWLFNSRRIYNYAGFLVNFHSSQV